MTRDEIFNYYYAYHSDYNKVKDLLNKIIIEHEKEIEQLNFKVNKKSSQELQVQEQKNKQIQQKKQDEIKEVVSLFDVKRKSIQPNFVRKEFGGDSAKGEYLLRKHIFETNRTPKMFLDAIRWLFSNNPKAEFHRSNTMNIEQLIRNFNKIEHDAMHSKESVKFSEEAQIWANVYKKKGFSDEEILQKLKEGGYIQ